MKIPLNKKLIFDNAVLSNFARINKLELLFFLSQELFTTREVIEEKNKGIPKKPILSDIIALVDKNKIFVKTLTNYDNIILMNNLIKEGVLGIGEISAMLSAKELNGIFITDDEQAHKKAISIRAEILNQQEFRDTVNFLVLLLKNKCISKSNYNEIINLLSEQSFKI